MSALQEIARVASILNGVGIAAVLGLVIKAWLDNKKLTIDENKGLRNEFIAEMHELRSEVKGLRDENESLRREVRELHGIIDGLRRDALQSNLSAQRNMVRAMPDDCVSEGIADAMDQLDRLPGRART